MYLYVILMSLICKTPVEGAFISIVFIVIFIVHAAKGFDTVSIIHKWIDESISS